MTVPSSTFAPSHISSLGNDPELPYHVAFRAVHYELGLRQQAAQSQAAAAAARLRGRIEESPDSGLTLSRTLTLAATDAALSAADDPMTVLPAIFEQRSRDSFQTWDSRMDEWIGPVLDELRAGNDTAALTQAFTVRLLRGQLPQLIESLTGELTAATAAAKGAEDALRTRTSAIARSFQVPAPQDPRESLARRPWLRFAIGAAASIVAGLALMALLAVPLIPVPLVAMVLCAGLSAWLAWRKPVQEPAEFGSAPYSSLRGQLIQFSRQRADAETLRLKLRTAEAALRALDDMPGMDTLPDALSAVLQVLDQHNASIQLQPWTGGVPTRGALTGSELITALWKVRQPVWTASAFDEAVLQVANTTVNRLLSHVSPTASARLLGQAAIEAMAPITLTETVLLMLTAIPNGERRFLGEFDAQLVLLRSLFPIVRYKQAVSDPACPQLLHVVVPSALMPILQPVLDRHFTFRLDYFAWDRDEIVLNYETFNRANNERANHAQNDHALRFHATRAREEAWSSFGPLLADSGPDIRSNPDPAPAPRAGTPAPISLTDPTVDRSTPQIAA